MKVVIFAGGYGTRLTEETVTKPKPMVEIGTKPIIWHIMKIYAHHGFRDFVVLAGYKAEYIKNYFLNFYDLSSDFTINLKTGEKTWINPGTEDWNVTVVDTGLETMTGGRLRRARHIIGDEPFFLTYGDGVSNVNMHDLLEHHRRTGAWATLTAVIQPGRYGALGLADDRSRVRVFREKAADDGGLINGGFFVCQPEVFDLIDNDSTVWEEAPMERMIERGKLGSFVHRGYWQSMDSLRDKIVLDKAWDSGAAPWKVWA